MQVRGNTFRTKWGAGLTVPLLCVVVGAGYAQAAGAAERSGAYAIERVSPVDTGGQRPTLANLRNDGKLVQLHSAGAFADAENSMLLGGAYLTERDATQGWLTKAISPPGSTYSRVRFDYPRDVSGDLQTQLFLVERGFERNSSRYVPLRREADGSLTEVGPVIDDSTASLATDVVGSSGDLRTYVLETLSRTSYTEGHDSRSLSQRSLMRVRPDSSSALGYRADQVAYRANATMLPNCQPVLGGGRSQQGAVSADGRQIIFSFPAGLTSCRNATNQRVWARIDDNDPVDLSAPQCTGACGGAAAITTFEGASLDGRKVYFTTAQKLVDGDEDTSLRDDLYVYDADAPGIKLRAITSSNAPVGAGVRAVTGVSADGTTVFFVANGRPLTSDPNNRGEVPQPNVDNLYVYHQARGSSVSTIRFVGAPSSDDLTATNDPTDVSWLRSTFSLPARTFHVSSDGAYALIPSHADLAGDRAAGDTYPDLFRYDVARDDLRRMWPGEAEHNGAQRTHGTYPLIVARQITALRRTVDNSNWVAMSDDGGTVALQTAAALDPADQNGVDDVYVWRSDAGNFQLLSGGSATRASSLVGVTDHGDVFFLSEAKLLPGVTTTLPAAYVARRGGGFPEPPLPPAPCVGDACQGERQWLPDLPPLPGTKQHVGPGNRVIANPTVSVAGARSARSGEIVIRVRSSIAGRLAVSGSRVVRSSRRAQSGRTYSVRVRLNNASRKTRNRGRDVQTTVRVRVATEAGGATTRSIKLRYRARKAR